jgi:hypothetical protein
VKKASSEQADGSIHQQPAGSMGCPMKQIDDYNAGFTTEMKFADDSYRIFLRNGNKSPIEGRFFRINKIRI